jgi:hypothetical protein
MRAAVLMIAGAALLAGCNPQPAPPSGETKSDVVVLDPGATPTVPHAGAPALSGFSHAAGVDHFGYFLPNSEVKVGNWKLENLSIGPVDEFAKWERGERTAVYAPVMFEFVDVTSPKQTNELGQEVYSRRVRVLPSAYKVGPNGDLRFTGRDDQVGDVQFDGTIDMALLAKARQAGPNAGLNAAPVVKGGLQVGATPFKNLSFNFFGGD